MQSQITKQDDMSQDKAGSADTTAAGFCPNCNAV
jgi:hypothetical protein